MSQRESLSFFENEEQTTRIVCGVFMTVSFKLCDPRSEFAHAPLALTNVTLSHFKWSLRQHRSRLLSTIPAREGPGALGSSHRLLIERLCLNRLLPAIPIMRQHGL